MSAAEREDAVFGTWSGVSAGAAAEPPIARPRFPVRTEPAVASGPEERRLVAAAQRGEPVAVRTLYDAYRNRIWSLILVSIGDPQQAQDVLQTVFFKVFRGLGGFRFESSLFTWIYRIARNECWSHRQRRREPLVPLDAIRGRREEIDPHARAAGADGAADRDRQLEDALQALPFRLREVVVLKYREGLSYEEMSRALGCAPGTVASRLSRALAELEERLRPRRPEAGETGR
jgi:RNA polymerase sigma-70 factor, ECF subfamily